MFEKESFVDKFYSLLQTSVGNSSSTDLHLSEQEWEAMFDVARKQSLLGVLYKSLEELSKQGQKPPRSLLLKWIGLVEKIKNKNHLVDKQCAKLFDWFKNVGCASCVIKGQGVARLYPIPDYRQSGDIDIWVDAERDEIVDKMRKAGIEVTFVDYVNCHAAFFKDTIVEVHFRPTWMFCPFTDKKVQGWIKASKNSQMANFDDKVGFGYPTIAFNLVFSLVHIYRHVLFEGIGLRQLTDYYYILNHSTDVERCEAMTILQQWGLNKFTGAVMYVMQKVFAMNASLLLCSPNKSKGNSLLEEIIRGGNFGKYDDRNYSVPQTQRMKRGFKNLRRNLRFLKDYPSEVLWMPAWKLWHWCWRKWHGYLK